MKKHLVMALLCATAPMLVAQESFVNRLSASGSLISTQGDFRTFTQKSLGFGIEAAYDITRNDDVINMRGFIGYLTVKGNERPDLMATFDLNGTRMGVDFTFKTPIATVVPYAGLTLTKWKGSSTLNAASTLLARQVDFSDNSVKFGFRVGVDYYLTKNLVLAADYNVSEWRHSLEFSNSTGNPKTIDGFNPMNPSWVTLTARYHF